MHRISEVIEDGPVPLWRNQEWAARLPWLLQGTTGAGESATLDFGMFGETPIGVTMARWRQLTSSTGTSTAVHSRQIHGARIQRWRQPLPAGLIIVDGFDAHLTTQRDLLLTVSVADCVPVFIAVEDARAIALVHAGWRGLVAGVLETAIDSLEKETGSSIESFVLHCGPSICRACYEVGPDVFESLHSGEDIPHGSVHVDLADTIGKRVIRMGVQPNNVSLSSLCTRCGDGGFFSHRGGSKGRQLGVLTIR